MEDKVRENLLRRVAARRGMRLQKSRRRDERAMDFGGYMLIDTMTNGVVAGANPYAYSLSMDQVEAWLADAP